MNYSANARTQYSPEQRAALVAKFRSSGQTQKDFAHRHGIKWTTFRNWLYGKKTAAAAASKPSFIGFQEIQAAPWMVTNPWAAEIALSDGTVLRVKAGADPVWVSQILQPLHRPC